MSQHTKAAPQRKWYDSTQSSPGRPLRYFAFLFRYNQIMLKHLTSMIVRVTYFISFWRARVQVGTCVLDCRRRSQRRQVRANRASMPSSSLYGVPLDGVGQMF